MLEINSRLSIAFERTCKLRNSPMCIIGQCKFVTLIRCNVFSTKQHEFNTSSSKCFACIVQASNQLVLNFLIGIN